MITRLVFNLGRFLFSPFSVEDNNRPMGYPLRWNLLFIAALIAGLNIGLIYLTYTAITRGGDNQFITGALIGLLPTGIAGLVGISTTLLNESRGQQGQGQ